MDNSHRHTDPSEKHSTEVKKCRKKNCYFRWKRIGIDDRSDGIGRIVKSVDKLKSTDESQTEKEEDKHSDIDSKHREKLDDLIIISYFYRKSQNTRDKMFDSIFFFIYLGHLYKNKNLWRIAFTYDESSS